MPGYDAWKARSPDDDVSSEEPSREQQQADYEDEMQQQNVGYEPVISDETTHDVRWAVNVLLEEIAAKFEANDTMDIWRSDAAALVRSFKHDIASPNLEPMTIDWPRHKAALHLTHNDHKSYYHTVAEAIADESHGYTEACWVSTEQKQKAIATNDCWTLQWYPDTPVGFFLLSAADLDVLLARARTPTGET